MTRKPQGRDRRFGFALWRLPLQGAVDSGGAAIAASFRLRDHGNITTVHVSQAVAGERQSLEWLAQRFTPLLRLQATHRLGGRAQPADVDDLVADAWAALLKRLPQLQPRNGRLTPVVLTFLAETIRRRALDLARKQRRVHALDASPEDSARSVIAAAERAETSDAMAQAISHLEPDERKLLILRGVEGLPYQTIAAQLDLLPNTVAQRYGRILKRLRSVLPGSIFDDMSDM